ncbi:MAG: hypothetical protein GX434_10170 [Peptococcaceae bacterium]|nr:hypothetical protein [Peptococcaceae bacterium]
MRARVIPFYISYPEITLKEIALRSIVDYLVIDGKVLEKTSAAFEPSTYVVYCEVSDNDSPNESVSVGLLHGSKLLEIRQYRDGY